MCGKLEAFLGTLCHEKGRPSSGIDFVLNTVVMPEKTALFYCELRLGVYYW